jgi:hypothetical protein
MNRLGKEMPAAKRWPPKPKSRAKSSHDVALEGLHLNPPVRPPLASHPISPGVTHTASDNPAKRGPLDALSYINYVKHLQASLK